MDQYQDIRRYYAEEGLSERAIAKLLGISRNTVSKYKNGEVLPGQRKQATRSSPVTGPVREIVLGYLAENESSPAKQQQHAKRIFDRLRIEHGFQGAYSTIRALVKELRGKSQVYIPLEFDPGQAAQVDWGSAYAYIGGVRTKVELFCMRMCNSGSIFVRAYPTQRYESFLDGHVQAFSFFAGVPRTLIYDNLRTAVKKGWGKNVREEQAPFRLLRAHYVFRSRYCNPRAGNEKGLVENLVSLSRRNVLSPAPRVSSFDELNETLRTYCLAYLDHKIQNRPEPVGQLLQVEQQHMLPLPITPFDPAIAVTNKANRYSLVRHDNCYYSIPVRLAGQVITVKAYPLRIELWHKGEMVAEHQRSYQQSHIQYKVEHYLPALERKPRAARDAAPVKRNVSRSILAFGEGLSDKDFVAVLKLTVDHGEDAVLRAIEQVTAQGRHSAEAVRFQLMQDRNPSIPLTTVPVDPALPGVRPVDLSQYDVLCKGAATDE